MTIAFRVDLNFINSSGYIANSYKLINWNGCRFNLGDRWCSDGAGGWCWQPVCEGEDPMLVMFTGQIWLVNVTPNGVPPQFVAKVWKNNQATEVGTGIGCKSNFNYTWTHSLTALHIAQPGDKFKLYQFVSDPTVYLDGHPQHTYWEGHVIGPAC